MAPCFPQSQHFCWVVIIDASVNPGFIQGFISDSRKQTKNKCLPLYSFSLSVINKHGFIQVVCGGCGSLDAVLNNHQVIHHNAAIDIALIILPPPRTQEAVRSRMTRCRWLLVIMWCDKWWYLVFFFSLLLGSWVHVTFFRFCEFF